MVGSVETVIESVVATKGFWRDEAMNEMCCASMVDEWASRFNRLGEFYSLNEARPGDILAFGHGWEDAMFAIFLAPGKVASSIKHPYLNPDCHRKQKLVLVRLESVRKPFIGGVHLE